MWLSPYYYHWHAPSRIQDVAPYSVHYLGKLGLMYVGASLAQGWAAKKCVQVLCTDAGALCFTFGVSFVWQYRR